MVRTTKWYFPYKDVSKDFILNKIDEYLFNGYSIKLKLLPKNPMEPYHIVEVSVWKEPKLIRYTKIKTTDLKKT